MSDLRSQHHKAITALSGPGTGISDVMTDLYDASLQKYDILRKDYDDIRERYADLMAQHSSACCQLEAMGDLRKQVKTLCVSSSRYKHMNIMLFMRTKHNMEILGVIPFIKLQKTTCKQ